MSDPDAGDDEAHLAALIAVLTRSRANGTAPGTPLQQWRARRLAALAASASGLSPGWPSPHR